MQSDQGWTGERQTETLANELVQRCNRQRRNRDADGPLLRQRTDQVFDSRLMRGAHRREDADASTFEPPQRVAEDGERRGVEPLQVVDRDEHRRAATRHP